MRPSLSYFTVLTAFFLSLMTYAQSTKQPAITSRLFVIFDDSGSMNDGKSLPLAQTGLRKLLEQVKAHSTEIGLTEAEIVFMNGRSMGAFGLMLDTLIGKVDEIQATGGTDLVRPISLVREALVNNEADQVFIFAFSDGQSIEPAPVEIALKSLLELNGAFDVHFSYLQVGEDNPALIEAINNADKNLKMFAFPRESTAQRISDFGGFEEVIAKIPARMRSASLRLKILEILKLQGEKESLEAEIQARVAELKALEDRILPMEEKLKKSIDETRAQWNQASEKIKNGQALSAALMDLTVLLNTVRGRNNTDFYPALQLFVSLTQEVDHLDNQLKNSRSLVTNLVRLSSEVREKAEDIKKEDAQSFNELTQEAKEWLNSQGDNQEFLKTVEIQLTSAEEAIADFRGKLGGLEAQTKLAQLNFTQTEFKSYLEIFKNIFGENALEELRRASRESGVYFNGNEIVYTGLHLVGGGGDSSGPTYQTDITIRNEGTMIELPGGSGGGGGGIAAKFINNGTYIDRIERTSLASGGNGYTLFFNNGNFIQIPDENWASFESYKWVHFENGFLIFKLKNNVVEKCWALSQGDFEKIAEEIALLKSPTEESVEELNRMMVKVIRGLKVGASATGDSLQYVVDALHKWADEEERESLEFDYSNTRKVKEQQFGSGNVSPVAGKQSAGFLTQLKSLDSNLPGIVLTIMLGAELAQPALERPSVSGGEKIGRGVLALVETRVAFGLTLGRTLNAERASAIRARSFIPRWTGRLFSWGLGIVIAVDAAQQIAYIGGLKNTPPWLESAVRLPVENIIKKSKGRNSQNLTDKNQRDQKVKQFLEDLKQRQQ